MNGPAWHLLRQGPQPAARNMALDDALLDCVPQIAAPALRFYAWQEPAASFGYSQKYSDIERWTLLRPLVRRPTGGGLVPHDSDWTYSLVFPAGHWWYELKATDSYQQVHDWVRLAFARLKIETSLAPETQKDIPGQCFIGTEKSDLLWRGRKIAGAAQRRTKTGLLIQGSVQPPPVPLQRQEWEQAMCEAAVELWSVQWSDLAVEGALAETARTLESTKYSQYDYTRRR